MTDSTKGYRALRRGRVSVLKARYFLTICTRNRIKGLTEYSLFQSSLAIFSQMSDESVLDLIACVFMPDHMHAVIELGHVKTLSETVRLYKGRMSPALRQKSLNWQKAYFDHRLRPEERLCPILQYMYKNPVVGGLTSMDELWPYWYCDAETWLWFSKVCSEDSSYPDWIKNK